MTYYDRLINLESATNETTIGRIIAVKSGENIYKIYIRARACVCVCVCVCVCRGLIYQMKSFLIKIKFQIVLECLDNQTNEKIHGIVKQDNRKCKTSVSNKCEDDLLKK